MRYSTPLRYPGGKSKLANFIKLIIRENALLDGHYAEPYAGGAGVAFSLLFAEYVSQIHINDIDKSLHAFWHSVLNETESLCDLIRKTRVTIREWHRQRAIQEDLGEHSMLEVGFSTFFLNRTNRSGIITGGVIGGQKQNGKWKLGARFNKKNLIDRIRKISRYRDRINLYRLDASEFITNVLPTIDQKAFVYLDPPYFSKGKGLYENSYEHEDHVRISDLIRNRLKKKWLVSYDFTPEICRLYEDFTQITYGIHYSAADRYRGSEVIIYPNDLKVPRVKDPTKIKM